MKVLLKLIFELKLDKEFIGEKCADKSVIMCIHIEILLIITINYFNLFFYTNVENWRKLYKNIVC